MFIYSVKATTLRFVLILALSVSVLIGLSAFYAAEEPVLSSVSYEGIRTETDRRNFLSAFGHKTTGDAQSTVEYALPATLDAVLLGYNEVQKEQGFDLSKYTGKTVMRYTYEIENYEGYEGKVYANLITYRDRVIGADLTGAGEGKGFVKPLGS